MPRNWTILLILAVAVLQSTNIPCLAAGKEEEIIWDEGKPKPPELTKERIERIMNRLAETDAEKAKELEQLREKDQEKFKAELRKVMRKQFEEKLKEQKGPRVGPGKPGRQPVRKRLQRRYDEFLEWLAKNFPEKAEKLAKLKEKNMELYSRHLVLVYRKYRRIFEASRDNPRLAEILEENLELKAERARLLRKIRDEKDDGKKKEFVKELEEVVSDRFNLIIRWKRIEYERLLTKLEKLKRDIEASDAGIKKWEDSKEENVKKRVEDLLSGKKKFKWD